jgi:hypothetical protein
VWELPPRQQSDEILRAVAEVCRSMPIPCHGLDYMAADPDRHRGEFMTITALADLATDPAELARFIADVNREFVDDDFPAARLDPDGRRGRPRSCRATDPTGAVTMSDAHARDLRRADCKLRIFAVLFANLSLEEALTVIYEVYQQLTTDLERARTRLH